MPQSTLLSIYNSLVQSHFDYCSLVWGNCGKTSNKLQELQNRAAQVITSSSYDVDVDSLFHKLSWKDLHSQRQIQKALMVFKSLNGLVPEYLTSKSHNQLFSSYIKRSRPSYPADFAEIWLAVMFWSPNSEMDAKKFQFFLLWEIPRRPTSSDLGGPPLWRIEGVLVTSILILQS